MSLEYLCIDQIDIHALNTVLHELCTNIIRHTTCTEYSVKWCITSDSLFTLTVVDHGNGFSKREIAKSGTLREDNQGSGSYRFGGYGLPLVEGLSDRVDYLNTEPHGTTVVAYKRLSHEE